MWEKASTRLEAHLCGIGALTREALVPIGSGPNSTPPLKRSRGDYGDETKIIEKNSENRTKKKNLTKSRADEAYLDSGH